MNTVLSLDKQRYSGGGFQAFRSGIGGRRMRQIGF